MRSTWFVTILFLSFHLMAAEPSSEFDPASLKPQWWESFNAAPGTLEEKSAKLIDNIQSIIPTMTETLQPEAKELVQRIALNFSLLEKSKKEIAVFVPPTTPTSETYPLDEALEIARKARSDSLVLKSLKDERQDRQNQIDAVQDNMDRLAKIYFKNQEPSEDHFLIGLNLINYKVALLAAKEEISQLDKSISAYESYLKRLNEEVEVAKNSLVATQTELNSIEDLKNDAYKQWQSAIEELKQKEAQKIAQAARLQADPSSPTFQLVEQQTQASTIAEMLAHEKYLSLEMRYALAKILVAPENIDSQELLKQSKALQKSQSDLSKKRDNLTSMLQRQLQRAGQLISLNADGEKGSPEILKNQTQLLTAAQANLLSLQKLESEMKDANFLQEELDDRVTKLVGGSRRFGQLLSDKFSSSWSALSEWIDTPLFYIGAKPVPISGLIKVALILMITFWGAQKIVDWINHLGTSRKRIEKSVLYRITRLIYYLLLILGVVIALTTLGFDFSSFLLIAGALGVGLGFGLQTIFNNFLSGLILLFESHVKVGDYIELAAGLRGEVKEINVRSTILAMNDGVDAIVPNSEMISTRVINWTLSHPYRKIRVPFTVAYGSDKELVRKVVCEGALKVPETLIKPGFSDPSVTIAAFGPTGIDFELYVWTNERFSKTPGRSLSDYLWMIDGVLKENNVEIPFPRTEIRMV